MFDLSCRLSYGHKVGDCGGFYQVRIFLQSCLQGVVVSSITSHPRGQVCCVPAASLSSYLRQRTLLEHSTFRQPAPVAGARCGRQLTAAKRVVGGTEAGFGSFPWMALVRAGQARCGGALIGDRWVSK